jgi:hypothetical protein
MDATVRIALQGFSAADIERLGELMQRVSENLERAAAERGL